MTKVSKKTVTLATKFCANHVLLQLISNEIIAQTTQENLIEAENIVTLVENLMVKIDENTDSINNILEKTNLKDANVFDLCTTMMGSLIDEQQELAMKLVAINNEQA